MARIQVSKDPFGRIVVSFPYHPVLVSKVKTLNVNQNAPKKALRSPASR